MRRRVSERRRRAFAEVNVTAFLSLMVVLVPFLLITSVFSQVVILDLQLSPFGGEASASSTLAPVSVIVRGDGLRVVDLSSNFETRIAYHNEAYDLEALSSTLQALKASNPERLDATILLEPQLSYDTLIQVMDTVRLRKIEQTEGEEMQEAPEGSSHQELFPRITIGDAPAR